MPPVNRKSFKLVNRVIKSFKIMVEDFTFAVTFLFRERERIRITFSAKLRTKLFTTINLRRIRTIYQVRLITSLTKTISSRTIKLSILPSEIKKAITTIIFQNDITFISKAVQKVFVTINQGRLRLLITPILAEFFTLGDYDPVTLGTLDTETLGDLDYVTT